jgi:DNA segregation ATPase FtsK/SpoIIIE, S-DNA-T family
VSAPTTAADLPPNSPFRPATGPVPVGPMLSMFDPLFLGVDEFGQPVYLDLVFRNLLAGGEPGGGKSGLLNAVASHAALCEDSRLVLFDGKLVELGMWSDIADEFVGPDLDHAIATLRRLQQVMNNRYAYLRAHNRRKISRQDRLSVITVIIDEIALYSATLGTKQQQEEFSALLRDLVARGRACGIPVVAATQRPSFDIIPTSLRDLFGYRAAFRCTTINSSNIVLGNGWAEQGYSATDIAPTNQGEAYLIAEGGIPRRIKVAYLTDAQIISLADYAAWIRRPNSAAAEPIAPAGTTVSAPVIDFARRAAA